MLKGFKLVAAAIYFFVVLLMNMLVERRRRGEAPADPTTRHAAVRFAPGARHR